jgi:hypothetical protein
MYYAKKKNLGWYPGPWWTGSFIQPGNIDPVVVLDDLPGMDDPTGGEYWASTGVWGPTPYQGRFMPHGF